MVPIEYSSQAAIEDYVEDEDFDCKEKYIAWNQQDFSEHIQEENDIEFPQTHLCKGAKNVSTFSLVLKSICVAYFMYNDNSQMTEIENLKYAWNKMSLYFQNACYWSYYERLIHSLFICILVI